jgi:membrane protease YdiL (CAAX protease family)
MGAVVDIRNRLRKPQAAASAWAWVAAALFALIITLAAPDRRTAGLTRPSCLRLTIAIIIRAAHAAVDMGRRLPDTRTTIIIACNTALVALSEELMFRSILLQGMLTRFPLLPSVLASSAIFGVVHAANGFSTGDMQTALWQSLAAARKASAMRPSVFTQAQCGRWC